MRHPLFDTAQRMYIKLCMLWVGVYLRHPINREYARLTFDYRELRGKEQRLWYYRTRLAEGEGFLALDRDYRRGTVFNTLAAALAAGAAAFLLFSSF